MTQEQFGARIRQLRKQRKMVQLDYANLCDMGTGYIANLENGKRNPRLDTISRLAEGFGMSISELLGDCDVPTSIPDSYGNRVLSIVKNLDDEDREDLLKIIRLYAKKKST